MTTTGEFGASLVEVLQEIRDQVTSSGSGLTQAQVDALIATALQAYTDTTALTTLLAGKQAVVANVSDTEIGYLDGVTSAIQTQINSKAASTDLANYTTTSALTTLLAGKQAVVANVSDTEIGYLDGVTSAIQTQINAKQATLTAGTNITISGNTIAASGGGVSQSYVDTNFLSPLATGAFVVGTGLFALLGASTVSLSLTGQEARNDLFLLDGSSAQHTVDTNTAGTKLRYDNAELATESWANSQLTGYTTTSALTSLLAAKQAVVANVSDAEIGYLDGVTSGIQTQIDGKQATLTAGTNITISGNTISSSGGGGSSEWTYTGGKLETARPQVMIKSDTSTGSGNYTHVELRAQNAATSTYFYADQSIAGAAYAAIYFNTEFQLQGASGMTFQNLTNGNTWIAGSLTQASDKKLKDDVQEVSLDRCKALVATISPKTYTRTDRDDGKTRLGFLADDFDECRDTEFDNLVGEVVKDGVPLKSLDYSRLTALLWKVVQNQEIRIAALEASMPKKKSVK